MKRLIVYMICILSITAASGRQIDNVVPFDSTEYYQRLFADGTEFDIRTFQPFPSFETYNQDHWQLIDAIQPISGYVYWEGRYVQPGSVGFAGRIVVYHGDRETYGNKAMYRIPHRGFFVACPPNICYSYIVAVREDNTSDLIDNEQELTKFLGEVDNIEEVLLQVKANGYWYDQDTLIGGAYKEESDRYLLYLMESSDLPVTFRSVKAILYKNGDFEVVSKITYEVHDVYIIS